MQKVVIENVSRSKSPLSLNFKDHSSVILGYGKSITVNEELLTPYINRRAKAGDFTLKRVNDTVKQPVKKKADSVPQENNYKKEDK